MDLGNGYCLQMGLERNPVATSARTTTTAQTVIHLRRGNYLPRHKGPLKSVAIEQFCLT